MATRSRRGLSHGVNGNGGCILYLKPEQRAVLGINLHFYRLIKGTTNIPTPANSNPRDQTTNGGDYKHNGQSIVTTNTEPKYLREVGMGTFVKCHKLLEWKELKGAVPIPSTQAIMTPERTHIHRLRLGLKDRGSLVSPSYTTVSLRS